MEEQFCRFLEYIRAEEFSVALSLCAGRFHDKDLLEVGSGTGQQLLQLKKICKSALGIEVSQSPYQRSPEVIDYDGKTIPFSDASFDVVFSSMVLEHLTDDRQIHSEMRRVLRPNGCGIHIVPLHAARMLTTITHYPATAIRLFRKLHKTNGATPSGEITNVQSSRPLIRKLNDLVFLPRHGEYGTRWTEYFHMTPRAWERRLTSLGWRVLGIIPIGIAYSGYGLTGTLLSINARRLAARVAGSSSGIIITEAIPQSNVPESLDPCSLR